MKNRFFLVSIASALLLLASFSTTINDRSFEIVKNLDIFVSTFKEVNASYVDEVNPSKLMRIAINTMLDSLDPYTAYIPEDDIEDYMTSTTGEYGGIGALVENKEGLSTVVLIYEGYPAQKAGLIVGDQILKINGIDIKEKSSDDISKLLKGQSKSEIVLTVKRFNNPKHLEVKLFREKIVIENVPYFGMVSSDIGYLKLTDFTMEAGQEVRNAVLELKANGATKIILDLRGNPGGLLNEAINVSNVFIPKGKEVVTTRGKLSKDTRIYNTLNDPTDTEVPLVVLTNSSSASAAEIVSGVVQDYDRGVLVGRKTFGKGLVQQTKPLAYNSQIKVTTSKYYIPSGRCIQAIDYSHRNPDGSVGKIPDSLRAEFSTSNGRLVYDGGGVSPDIEVQGQDLAQITYTLLKKDLIFHYATKYFFTHKEIKPAADFSLSDQEYQDFVNWLQGRDYDYTTRVERDIQILTASAKEDKYYSDIAAQIEALSKATLHNKEQDLINFQKEIKGFLEQEICGRYYFQDGIIASTLARDEDVKTAIDVLNDPTRYKQILKAQ